MLTRIRNANQALHKATSMPSSKMKEEVAKLLAAEGYIDGFDVAAFGPGKELTIKMKYTAQRDRVLSGLKRISTPGRRIYRGSDSLPRSQGGLGILVISTSQGLLSDREARKRKLGGELICEVW